jgi:putative SOS response-associated peptidase YedK
MCCRFALYSDPFSLAKRFGVEVPPDLRPRYNIAPPQIIPIVHEENNTRGFCADPLGPDSALGEGYEDWLAHD